MQNNINGNLCKLCGTPDQVKSHILPKFIFRWLKKTGTGRLRNIENINLPTEDGIVKKFLCKHCEDKFNRAETEFANNAFYPVINKNTAEFVYDKWFKYFIVSIFWRTLKDSIYEHVENTKWHNVLLKIEKVWSDYLNNDISMNNFDEIHCIAGVDLLEEKRHSNFVMYMSRRTDAGIPNNDDFCFFYVKIPRFIFIMPIYGIDLDLFENSKIENAGTFELKNVNINETIIANYLFDRANEFENLKSKMSDKQKQASRSLTIKQEKNWKNKDLGVIDEYLKKF
ncbi:DUF2616 domain-containing protein [Brumimicrobium aurantiacum]|uniref:DUF2616 domain-containing protein n=1 Tax=Brumimicrobium aurantiacum TaxID=1737063 RepID=A0A3E1EUE8_9FLAO|nr:DUF2616 domain-containing protein [Brumimicrobium aurantiacum]RFC53189.1 DUF2616 domain-containing protein [Brumimicrobium aurantiacum]